MKTFRSKTGMEMYEASFYNWIVLREANDFYFNMCIGDMVEMYLFTYQPSISSAEIIGLSNDTYMIFVFDSLDEFEHVIRAFALGMNYSFAGTIYKK